jgi:hypothetical protein
MKAALLARRGERRYNGGDQAALQWLHTPVISITGVLGVKPAAREADRGEPRGALGADRLGLRQRIARAEIVVVVRRRKDRALR